MVTLPLKITGLLVTLACFLSLAVAHLFLLLMLWGNAFSGLSSASFYLGVVKLLATYVVMASLAVFVLWRECIPFWVPVALAVVAGAVAYLCLHRGVFVPFEEWLIVDGTAPIIMTLIVALGHALGIE